MGSASYVPRAPIVLRVQQTIPSVQRAHGAMPRDSIPLAAVDHVLRGRSALSWVLLLERLRAQHALPATFQRLRGRRSATRALQGAILLCLANQRVHSVLKGVTVIRLARLLMRLV